MTSDCRFIARPLAAIALAGLLAGCISVLPKDAPVQLYRFGAGTTAAPVPDAPVLRRFSVRLTPIRFDEGAAGDRILTVTGDQAAYIKGARWLSPASDLFEAAVIRTFSATPGPVRLVAGADPAHVADVLKLDVRAFEARYADPRTAPTVIVEVHAALVRVADHSELGERTFREEIRAEDNRVGVIAEGFDGAVGKALESIVSWVSTTGGA